MLAQTGLVVGDITAVGITGSTVIGQNPEAGASVPAGSRVNLRVAGEAP
jgi:hypothetical protein